jgi:cyclohexanecarboxylate-CoA ligase
VKTPWEQRHSLADVAPVGADDPACVIYTSGTTGQSKGVAHSLNTLYAAGRTFSDIYRLTERDVISIPHFLTHLAGSTYSIYLSVAIGGTCVMQDMPDMGVLLDLVAEHGITLIFGAPLYITGLVAAQRAKPRDLKTLRCLNTGSTAIPAALVADAAEILGVPIDSNFGMTELGAVTITRRDDPAGWAAHSDGTPVDWIKVRIDTAPGDDFGRLLVRGASRCLGYVNQREAFAACLEDGWFDTGDLARDDGRGGIRITGRRADLIVRADAYKVPTLEVETLLSKHPAVREVVIIGYPDPDVPTADRPAAVVVPIGEPPTLDELTALLSEQGMAQRFWPDKMAIVPEMPRNSMGKILRSVLRKDFELGLEQRA